MIIMSETADNTRYTKIETFSRKLVQSRVARTKLRLRSVCTKNYVSTLLRDITTAIKGTVSPGYKTSIRRITEWSKCQRMQEIGYIYCLKKRALRFWWWTWLWQIDLRYRYISIEGYQVDIGIYCSHRVLKCWGRIHYLLIMADVGSIDFPSISLFPKHPYFCCQLILCICNRWRDVQVSFHISFIVGRTLIPKFFPWYTRRKLTSRIIWI